MNMLYHVSLCNVIFLDVMFGAYVYIHIIYIYIYHIYIYISTAWLLNSLPWKITMKLRTVARTIGALAHGGSSAARPVLR